jgi:hypothetical protein
MRKLFLFTILFFSMAFCYSQNPDSLKRDSVGTDQVQDQIQIRNSYQDSMDRASMDRNLSNLVSMQKERERKEKQQVYIRIALGAFFLIVLIVGLTRKRKQKNKAS